MFVASYRNTERGISSRPKPTDGPVLLEAKREAKKVAEKILADAAKEAEAMIERAKIEADRIVANAVDRASEIVSASLQREAVRRLAIDIIRDVARKHGISVETIKSSTRTKHIVEARHEAMALVYTLRPDLSLPQIGKIFERDHTTILYAVRKAKVYRGDEARAAA